MHTLYQNVSDPLHLNSATSEHERPLMTPSSWHPRYVITSATSWSLMEIEAARAVVDETPLPLAVEAELRRRAHILWESILKTPKTGYTEKMIPIALRWSLGRC